MTPIYRHLASGAALSPLQMRPFCAVIVAELAVAEAWQEAVAAWLVEAGCLYAIAWGIACEQWHDSIDRANLREFEYSEIPGDRFVMTTWHADQPLAEAFWFAAHCAEHPDVTLADTVIFHIADQARQEAILQAFRESAEVGEDE